MRVHKKYMKQLNRNAGFSLLELLIAVAIMAVLIGASLTTYRVVSKSNVKNVRRQLWQMSGIRPLKFLGKV